MRFFSSVVLLGTILPKVADLKLTVHLVHHSHDDVGWLKTVDEYYYGENMGTHNANVSKIYDTVYAALKENKERKFSLVEMKFFSMWWEHQDENKKIDVRKMVKNG
jgi:hypothetical protein